MTNQILNDCYQDLLEELEENKSLSLNPLQRVLSAMRMVKTAISQIREILAGFTFIEELTELAFISIVCCKYMIVICLFSF